jgi:hypothetical protein
MRKNPSRKMVSWAQEHNASTGALMHDASGQWGSRNQDSRCIPDVEGMLASVKQSSRRVDEGHPTVAVVKKHARLNGQAV